MNPLQYYLTKLAEEGSEVAQIALKAQQFGAHEVMPGQPLNNFERCHQELDDLWAIVEELNEKFGFGYTPNKERVEAKKMKVRKYLSYSIHLGMVEGEAVGREHPMVLPASEGACCLSAPYRADKMGAPAKEVAREHDNVRSALVELVALKDQKEAAEKEAAEARAVGACPSVKVQLSLRDYEERKPAAWDAARAALGSNKS